MKKDSQKKDPPQGRPLGNTADQEKEKKYPLSCSKTDQTGKIQKIHRILKKRYPDVKTQLLHENPFQLLVATILSAQCTDRQVNQVTPKLFSAFATPKELGLAPIEKIERIIYSTGFYKNKAAHIKAAAQIITERFRGRVPDNMEDLVSLPGVGRKTANVVLSMAFNKPAIVVDTHVARISGRLGLTENKDPVKIEKDLQQILPRKEWNGFCLRLIYFGREICRAKNPLCNTCELAPLCRLGNYGGKK